MAIVLEGGQRFSMTLTQLTETGESGNWRVELNYRKPGLIHALAGSLRGWHSALAALTGWQLRPATAFGYGLAVLLLGLTAALAWMLWPERRTVEIANKESAATAIPAESPSPHGDDSLVAQPISPSSSRT